MTFKIILSFFIFISVASAEQISHMAIDQKDEHGETALIRAAANGQKKEVESLLARGAQMNEKDQEGQPALYYAVMNGFSDIALLLIRRGADIHQPNILFSVATKADGKVFRELMKRAPELLNQTDPSGETPVFTALRGHQYQFAIKMIKRGARVNVKNKVGRSLKQVADEVGLPAKHPLRRFINVSK